ncbi:hypothetical protein [Nostoc sp. KVJ20]|uniref:hypothetical protein n=1 Tax=Nostoc sp. KVJ20 TaxID=457944 RepID=UPI000A0138EE|nr:hypothetical protein [Nostoc sp. KVJ20]
MVTLTSDLSALKSHYKNWGLGIGDWALGIGHWALGIGRGVEGKTLEPIPHAPCPIPHSLFT